MFKARRLKLIAEIINYLNFSIRLWCVVVVGWFWNSLGKKVYLFENNLFCKISLKEQGTWILKLLFLT